MAFYANVVVLKANCCYFSKRSKQLVFLKYLFLLKAKQKWQSTASRTSWMVFANEKCFNNSSTSRKVVNRHCVTILLCSKIHLCKLLVGRNGLCSSISIAISLHIRVVSNLVLLFIQCWPFSPLMHFISSIWFTYLVSVNLL